MTELELLEFARGPALWVSLGVLAAGSLWRIAGILRLGGKPDLAEPRSTRLIAGALRATFARMLPHPAFRRTITLAAWNGYVYHAGLAVIVFGYLPHIDFVKRLLGLAWPALPEPVVYAFVGLTFVSLFVALIVRLNDPVRRLLSGFDDYFSWFVVVLPLFTGMMTLDQSYATRSAAALPLDPLPVAVHLLSVELLLVWLPFGRLAHAFLVFASRAVTGAALTRKGAAQ
ncbi:MAG: nitrate reductase [Betaproteobacteria bacterium]|nr:nitrate reductase [Betaproteobacteria bacterium]